MARQAEGCGELEQLVLSHKEIVTMIQPRHLPDGTHVIVEAQLSRPARVPEEAMRHAATQLGWHVQSNKPVDALHTPPLETRRTPETTQHAAPGAP